MFALIKTVGIHLGYQGGPVEEHWVRADDGPNKHFTVARRFRGFQWWSYQAVQ